jgi:hypothetical protein
MFCVKCGIKNPEDGAFCYKCGNALFSPQEETLGFRAAPPPDYFPVEATPTPQGDLAPKAPVVLHNYRWVTAYGWSFIAFGLFLLLTGLITLLTSRDVTPPAVAFGHAKQIGIVAAIFQGLLWVATGLAIVQKKKIAVKLVWINVALYGLGVLFRGLIPGEILVWLLELLLAIWFKRRAAEGPGALKPAVGP